MITCVIIKACWKTNGPMTTNRTIYWQKRFFIISIGGTGLFELITGLIRICFQWIQFQIYGGVLRRKWRWLFGFIGCPNLATIYHRTSDWRSIGDSLHQRGVCADNKSESKQFPIIIFPTLYSPCIASIFLNCFL